MRADRLVATLLFLQSRGRVTAAELAEELEVSVKTARRDLEALSMAGIPVYPQAGRNGGWQLLGGSRTDLSGLTQTEARTLFMVAGPASTATPEAKAALRKLVQALPETFRADAEQAASSVVLDAASWGAEQPLPPEFLEPLRRAVAAAVQVNLGYADRTRSESTRVVHPLGLVEKGSTWYLIANTDKGLRTFRLNRVRSVEFTSDPVERPDGFDLAEAWQGVVDHVEERRNEFRAGATAVVRVSRQGVEGLKYAFGSTVRVLGAVDGQSDLFDVEVGSRHPAYIAERLAGWAQVIDVLDTEENAEVRKHLADIGRVLVDRYGADRVGDRAVRPSPG
jgi:predicted DNA-binding transcriptional regulator YafY